MLASRRSVNCALSAFPPPTLVPAGILRHRCYATGAKLGPDEDHSWWPSHPLPTPYQIFRYNQQTPYSKSRYYQLVKLYHPDHARHRRLHISEAVRVERFRLIVSANAILSDPTKRAAYDRFGLGWNLASTPAHDRPNSRWWTEREGHGAPGSDEHYGKGGPYDPSRNATWEDWEKYYQRKNAAAAAARGEPVGDESQYSQSTIHTSNRAFITIVAFLASLGGLANLSRANLNGQKFSDEADSRSVQLRKDLQNRREEAVAFGSKDERIQAFLKSRDPIGYGVLDPQAEKIRKILPPGEMCISDDIQKRSLDPYHRDSGEA